MKVSISQAAKMAGISRSNLYKSYINTHKISTELDHLGKKVIDQSEILRVFGKIHEDSGGHTSSVPQKDRSHQEETALVSVATENMMLRQELSLLKSQLEGYQEREKWFQKQMTDLTSSFKLIDDKGRQKRMWPFKLFS